MGCRTSDPGLFRSPSSRSSTLRSARFALLANELDHTPDDIHARCQEVCILQVDCAALDGIPSYHDHCGSRRQMDTQYCSRRPARGCAHYCDHTSPISTLTATSARSLASHAIAPAGNRVAVVFYYRNTHTRDRTCLQLICSNLQSPPEQRRLPVYSPILSP